MIYRRQFFVMCVLFILEQNVQGNPGQEDMQPMLNAAALQAAEAFPNSVAVARLVIKDCTLSSEDIAACLRQLDEVEKKMTKRYADVKSGTPATEELVNPTNPVLKVVQTEIKDQREAHAVIMQIVLETTMGNAAALFPKQATDAMRRIIKPSHPNAAQQKAIEGELLSLDRGVAEVLKVAAGDNGAVTASCLAKARPQLEVLSRGAWSNIRKLLSKEQRRDMVAGAPSQ